MQFTLLGVNGRRWRRQADLVLLIALRLSCITCPEAECFKRPVGSWSFEFNLKADSVEKTAVTWSLPEAEGCYWLCARTTGIEGRPVVSQRFVRGIAPPAPSQSRKEREFIVLGGDHAAKAFFASRGLPISSKVTSLDPRKDVVVVWNAAHLSLEEKQKTQALEGFLGRGGRMIQRSSQTLDLGNLHVA